MGVASLCLAVLLAFAEGAAPAPATGAGTAEKARAQVLLREGAALHEAGDHAAALEKFQAAYRAYPSPKILFNVGEAYRGMARYGDALTAYEEFLAKASDAPAQSLAEARQSVAELKTKLGRIAIDCRTPGAEVSVDGRRIGLTPIGQPVWAEAGRHQVAVRHADHVPSIEDVEVTAGAVRTLSITLRALTAPVDLAPPVAPPPTGATLTPAAPPITGDTSTVAQGDESPSLTRRWWFWTAIGVVVVVGMVGIILATSGDDTPNAKTTLGTQPGMPVPP